MEVRLMTVSTSTCKTQPRILLTGSLLDRLGFPPEMLVTVSCQKEILTLKACGMGLDCYRQVVGQVRKQRGQLIQAFKWTRKKTETHLVLEGHWLEKQGFYTGDVLLVSFKRGLIRIKRLNLSEFGFSSNSSAIHQILSVQTENGTSQIALNMHYLEAHGFLTGQTASITYKADLIRIEPCHEPSQKRKPRRMPARINILLKRNHAYLRLNGSWLLELGYAPGDFLMVQCQPGLIQICRLESHHFSF